jgi:hypothetical protein
MVHGHHGQRDLRASSEPVPISDDLALLALGGRLLHSHDSTLSLYSYQHSSLRKVARVMGGDFGAYRRGHVFGSISSGECPIPMPLPNFAESWCQSLLSVASLTVSICAEHWGDWAAYLAWAIWMVATVLGAWCLLHITWRQSSAHGVVGLRSTSCVYCKCTD